MQWLNAPQGPFGPDNTLLGLKTLLHLQLYQYYIYIAFTLLICNFLFTFEKERVYVWKQAKNLPFYMFLVLRYFPIIVLIAGFNLRYFIRMPEDSGHGYDVLLSSLDCRILFFRLSLGPVITVVSGVILMLRVKAIYEKDRRVIWFLLVIYLCQIMTTIWALFDDSPEHGVGLILLRETCPTVDELTDNNPRGVLPLFATTVAFDFVIFILTLRKGLQERARGVRSTLLQVVVQGGNIYFITLLLVNLSNAILAVLAMKDFSLVSSYKFPWIGAFMGNMNIQLAAAITSIIVSKQAFVKLLTGPSKSIVVLREPPTPWANGCAPPGSATLPPLGNRTPIINTHTSFKGPGSSQNIKGFEEFDAELPQWQYDFDDDNKLDGSELAFWPGMHP
ncbi:hypothetical protein M422DRAFT_253450 [Sphaerobolus stellatus SS14]|uniref:Uncharacterized protein n=1 Tax=Sphaerobolus stellatus (strain SS14) TaxID=990650 RepID=A0A0C9V8C5_SPHS4|nr:hypothetical protein M422DRAFT_253450 [Sphaerobolus stellatus SS14]